MTGRPRRLVPLLALALVAGCDLFGPRGPGTLTARLEHPGGELGAAVVEVSGAGVRGFSAAAGSRVLDRFRDDADEQRLVVVNPERAGLAFGIEVEEVGARPPAVRVVEAADTANAPIADGGAVVVRIER